MPKRKYILPLFLVFQIIAVWVLSYFPQIVEKLYSTGMYPVISRCWRLLLGWIPFSVGDWAYALLLSLFLRWLWRNRKTWRAAWKNNLLQFFSWISVLYFAFHLFWAMNYHRLPLYEKLGIEKEYSEADLIRFTEKLIVKANAAQLLITQNAGKKVVFPYTQRAVFVKCGEGYSVLAKKQPAFAYKQLSIKRSIYSLPLTYMGFAGYLNPFTGEAQVNDKVEMYNFPFTCCHEMAHQIGFASESEANFAGFLANVENPDVYFRYSGYSFALRYCLSAMEKNRKGSSKPFLSKINQGILENYKDSRKFWLSYHSFIDDGFAFFYDHFLKWNKQKDGMEGYSKFVGLMVNYYRDKTL